MGGFYTLKAMSLTGSRENQLSAQTPDFENWYFFFYLTYSYQI